MRATDGQARGIRRRAGLGLLLTGALVGAACSATTDEVATGPADGGTTIAADNSETDAAALARALGGIETTTTADPDSPAEGASGAENCAQFTYREDAQSVLEADLADPYHLDEDGNGVACDGLPTRPVQSLPPQTLPPQTQPPQTLPPQTVTTVPPAQTAAQPQQVSPSGDEKKVVDFVNSKLGKSLIPEATLFNGARSGQTSPPGPVVYPFFAYAQATGGGSIDNLLPYLAGQLGSFGQCTHVGVGILADPAGTKILVLCGKF